MSARPWSVICTNIISIEKAVNKSPDSSRGLTPLTIAKIRPEQYQCDRSVIAHL